VGVQQKLMRHASVATTMDVYGAALTTDMAEASGKIATLAFSGTGTARKPV